MNTKLQEIYDTTRLALQIKDGDVYCKIISVMKCDCKNTDVFKKFDDMIYMLRGAIYFDEDKTPKQLSLDCFGFNLFPFDLFDYYLMADSLVIDELEKLFKELELAHELPKEYNVNKSNILSIFEPKERYIRHTGKNYPYHTALFADYLEERKDWLVFLEKEINILDKLLGG